MFGWDLALLDRPELGWAPGSAYATVLSRAIAAGIGIWWLRRKDHLLRLSGGLRRGPRSQRRQVLWLGIPQTLQMLARATSVIALSKIAIDVGGQDAVVALGVTTRLDMLVVFAAAGFASAATTLVGRQVGEGDWRRARVACWLAGLQGAMFATVFVTLFGLFAVEITGWFVRGAGEEVLFAASDYLRIAAWAHLPAAFCLAVTGGINGAGRTFWPMVADAAGHWLFLIPCVAFFASGQCELRPVWYAWIVGQGVLAIAFALLVRRLSR
jgi:Na+-driven multidrug efflux pump